LQPPVAVAVAVAVAVGRRLAAVAYGRA
jgi:hypothetical protein